MGAGSGSFLDDRPQNINWGMHTTPDDQIAIRWQSGMAQTTDLSRDGYPGRCLPEYRSVRYPANSLLIFNNTRVIRADSLSKGSGGLIEILSPACEPISDFQYGNEQEGVPFAGNA